MQCVWFDGGIKMRYMAILLVIPSVFFLVIILIIQA